VPTGLPRRPLRAAFPVVAAAAAVVLALSGCAASTDPAAEGNPGAPASAGTSDLLPAPEGTTQYPLTLTSWAGDTVLPERPERVAVIGFSTNFDVVEVLDVTPVYAITEESPWAWRDAAWLESIEYTDTATRRDETNFEAIAATNPDVIVALNYVWDEADFEKLAAIAPVIEYEEQQGDKADWRLGQLLVGEALDLEGAAQTAIDDADTAIASIADAHPEFVGKTATIGTDYGPESGFDYYTPTGGTAEGVLQDLGFTPNPLAENFVADPAISDENLGLLDADVLIVVYQNEAVRATREAQPLFAALSPVADGRYTSLASDDEAGLTLVTADGDEVDNATWVLRRGASALSLPWAVDVIANQWLAGIDLDQ
jgi:iron complex transport system substrate-binding protein